MMIKSRKQHLLLLVVLAACSPGLASAKKNILSQIGNIISESGKTDSPTADYDAATGTVIGSEGKKDNSCDAQLARDILKATDLAAKTQKDLDEESSKHKAALETIVDLQKNLAKTTTDLVNEKEDKLALKSKMDESHQQIIERSKEEVEEVTTKAAEALEALREEKDKMIADIKEESSRTLEETKKISHEEFQSLKNRKDEMIANLEAKLKMSSEELQETMRLELVKAKEDRETQVAAVTANWKRDTEKMILALEESKEESSALLQKTKEEAEAAMASLRADRDKEVASLKALLEKEVSERDQQVGSIKAVLEKEITEKNAKIQSLQETKESLEEAKSEIDQWRSLHASRSYCNMTHVAEDLYDAGASAYKQASDKAVEVYDQSLEYSSKVIQDKYNEHWPAIAPIYDDVISGNYERIEPHLESHVFPHVRKAHTYAQEVVKPKVLEAIDDGKNAVAPVIEEKYQSAADIYEGYCRSSFQEFVKATKEVEVLKDHPPPLFLLESWATSCENPRDSISALLQGFSALLALVFWRRILGLAWSIALLPVYLFVKLTPLRFFFFRKPATKATIESPPSSPSPLLKEASSETLMKANSSESLIKAIADDENEGEIVEGEADATLY